MEQEQIVLCRLDRIDALERAGAPASVVLDEVRALLLEAEAWARREGPDGERALAATDRCRAALDQGRVPLHAG
jgi:hypothetical protein